MYNFVNRVKTTQLCIFKRVNFMSLTCYKQKPRIPVLKQRLSAKQPAVLFREHLLLPAGPPQVPLEGTLATYFLLLLACPYHAVLVLYLVHPSSLVFLSLWKYLFTRFCCQVLLRKFCFCYRSCSVGFYAKMWKRLKHYDVIPCHLSRSL